jgi:FKBP-type peptidyl-prolyl cis-trans isomerase SlyD
MKVSKDKVVLMHYTLKNDKGEVIDSSEGAEPLAFLQGHGNIIPGLEKALEGSKLGDKKEVSIEPEEAYGLRMDDAIQDIPGSALQGIEEVTVGMQLQSQDQDGNPFVVTVVKIDSAPSTIITEPSVSTTSASKTKVSTTASKTKVSNTVVTDTTVIHDTSKTLDDKIITVDANHPLAGETLHFSVSIEEIRDANKEELSHGHVHAPGGHSH